MARATPIGTTSTVTPSGLAASTALMASPTFSLPSDITHEALLAGLRKRRGGQPNRRGQVRPFRADDRLDLLQVHRGVGRGLDAGFGAEDDDAGLVLLLLLLGDAVDVIPGGFLLRGGDAVRAVQREEHIHAFHRPQPLEAGNRKHQGGQHHDANPQRRPAPPGADLHVGLPGKPNHPRQRRRQQQQVIGMGELEVHRMSFCTRWFCESAT